MSAKKKRPTPVPPEPLPQLFDAHTHLASCKATTADEVRENTSFEVSGLDSAESTRAPSEQELYVLNELVDPKGLRFREVPREEDAK